MDTTGRAERESLALREEIEALKERERDLTDSLENASVAMHWVGADGTILWANRCELDLLGYSHNEYFGRHISAFHADQPVIDDILERLANKETLKNYEARLRAKDGSILYVQISSSVRWDHGRFLHTRCSTRDMTARRLYEQRLLTQHGVVRMLSGAATLIGIAPALLEFIGTQLDWDAGFLWSAEGGQLHCVASWNKDPARPGSFERAWTDTALSAGQGLPGRVLAGRQSCWIPDVTRDVTFPRAERRANFRICASRHISAI